MSFTEIKKFVICVGLLLIAIFAVPKNIDATDYSSGSFTIKDPILSSGFQNSNSLNFGLGQSLSQLAIGQSTSASFQLWSGFQYYYKVLAHTLSVTPDNAEVDLIWTVPTTYLGVEVAGYEIGTGTTSGSYTFEDVGNVAAFTKTGLTNGTLYYFISKAYAPGGTFLVYSNEVSATPNGVVIPPPPPGGGGGGSQGSINISGTAYPNAPVTVLRDSNIVSIVNANTSGNFSVTLNNQPTGTYTYTLYATDQNGIRSPSLGFEQVISKNVISTVSGLIIAPTIQQSLVSVKQGDMVTFSGYSAPNVSVTLTFSGKSAFTRLTNSNASGLYSYSLSTSDLQKGEYFVNSYSLVNFVNSPLSFSLRFIVGDQTVVPPPTGDCRRSDLNCDGRVDLVDFSILLYFWEEPDFTRNPRADIDKSGDIGLRDLSIMLYDWTG